MKESTAINGSAFFLSFIEFGSKIKKPRPMTRLFPSDYETKNLNKCWLAGQHVFYIDAIHWAEVQLIIC
jgi:hypothetical protein